MFGGQVFDRENSLLTATSTRQTVRWRGVAAGDTAMFDYSLHPYLRWIRGRSQDGGPSFDIDWGGLPPQTLLPHTGNFPTPESQALSPSAPSTGLAGFMVEQPNEVRAFA